MHESNHINLRVRLVGGALHLLTWTHQISQLVKATRGTLTYCCKLGQAFLWIVSNLFLIYSTGILNFMFTSFLLTSRIQGLTCRILNVAY